MDKDHLRTGDKASCLFRFIKSPEYLHNDSRMVFREGRTKAIGTITKLYPYVPGSGSGVSVTSSGVSHSTKKKPSQIPKTVSGGSVGRVKGRRGRGRHYHHVEKMSSAGSVTTGGSLEPPPSTSTDHKQ